MAGSVLVRSCNVHGLTHSQLRHNITRNCLEIRHDTFSLIIWLYCLSVKHEDSFFPKMLLQFPQKDGVQYLRRFCENAFLFKHKDVMKDLDDKCSVALYFCTGIHDYYHTNVI